MRRYVVPIVAAVMVTLALAVLWLSTTTAYGPSGNTRCGPALQEWRQTFDEVAGRCHLARQERMRLGLAMAALMLGATVPLWLWRTAIRPSTDPASDHPPRFIAKSHQS